MNLDPDSPQPEVAGWIRTDKTHRLIWMVLGVPDAIGVSSAFVILYFSGVGSSKLLLGIEALGIGLPLMLVVNLVFLNSVRPTAVRFGEAAVEVRRLFGRARSFPQQQVRIRPARRDPQWGVLLPVAGSSLGWVLSPAQFAAGRASVEEMYG